MVGAGGRAAQFVRAAGEIRNRTLFPRAYRGHSFAAIRAKGQAGKEVFKCPFPVAAAGGALPLHRVEGLLRDKRLVLIRHNDPCIRPLFAGFPAFEADFIGLALRDVAQVDNILQNAADPCGGPLPVSGIIIRVQSGMRLAAVYRGRRLAALVQCARDLCRPPARGCPGEDPPHHHGRPLVRDKMVFVLWIFLISVRRKIADEPACLHFGMQCAADLAAGVARVHLVDDVAERRQIGIRPRGIDAVVDRDQAHAVLREHQLQIPPGLDIVAAKA